MERDESAHRRLWNRLRRVVKPAPADTDPATSDATYLTKILSDKGVRGAGAPKLDLEALSALLAATSHAMSEQDRVVFARTRKALEHARRELASRPRDEEAVERADAALNQAKDAVARAEDDVHRRLLRLAVHLLASERRRSGLRDELARNPDRSPTYGCIYLDGFWDGYGSVINPIGQSIWIQCSNGRAIANDWAAVIGDFARAWDVTQEGIDAVRMEPDEEGQHPETIESASRRN